MWCRNVRNELSAYADGELPLAAAHAVEEHLVQCERCASEHAAIRKLVSITRSAPQEALPAGLQDRILARLAYTSVEAVTPAQAGHSVSRAVSRRMVPGPWMWPALTGATAALAMGFAYSSSNRASAIAPPADTRNARIEAPRPSQRTAVAAPKKKAEPRRVLVATPRPPQATREASVSELVTASSMPEAATPEPAAISTKKTQIAAAKRVEPAVRVVKKPARAAEAVLASREARPQPLAAPSTGEKPTVELRATEPSTPVTPAAPVLPAGKTMMTGEPAINNSGPGAPSDAAMGRDREPGTRMAGMTSGMMPETTPVQDEEGVRSLRMFLEERNRTVPQPPPAVPSRDRRMQKSL